MLRPVLVLVLMTSVAKAGSSNNGWIQKLNLLSSERLAHLLQPHGERFGRILDRHVDLAVRGLPPNIVEQLEDKSTEDIFAEGLSTGFVRQTSLSEDERAALRAAIQRSIWYTIKEILDFIMDAMGLLMDPASFGDFDFHLDNDLVRGNLSLKSLTAGHLREVRITNYTWPSLPSRITCVGADFLLPALLVLTDYDVDVTVELEDGADDPFRIYGAGPARIEMANIKMYTDICVKILGFGIEVRNMKISVENDSIELQNLFGGGAISDLISGVATDVLPAMVQELQPQIVDSVMNYINTLIRNIISPWGKTATPSSVRSKEN